MRRAATEIYRTLRSEGNASTRAWLRDNFTGYKGAAGPWEELWSMATQVDFALSQCSSDAQMLHVLGTDDWSRSPCDIWGPSSTKPAPAMGRVQLTCEPLERQAPLETLCHLGWYRRPPPSPSANTKDQNEWRERFGDATRPTRPRATLRKVVERGTRARRSDSPRSL